MLAKFHGILLALAILSYLLISGRQRKHYRNPWLYPVIARANDIENPDLIIAGARLFIPEQ